MRFSLLIKAFVASRDDVSVISALAVNGDLVVRVLTAQQDRKRLVGRGSQVAHSLRVLLDCIGEQQGVRYVLEINGACFYPGSTESTPVAATTAAPELWTAANTLPAF